MKSLFYNLHANSGGILYHHYVDSLFATIYTMERHGKKRKDYKNQKGTCKSDKND